jgi:hypothetical protein
LLIIFHHCTTTAATWPGTTSIVVKLRNIIRPKNVL